jgi:hypothetical protein
VVNFSVQYYKVIFLIFILPLTLSVDGQAVGNYLPFVFEKDPAHLNISSEESEIGPLVIGNELWFSLNKYTYTSGKKLKRSKSKFYNLVKAGIEKNGDIKPGISDVKGLENSCHVGPVSFCEKTGELFITASNVGSPDLKNSVFRKKNFHLVIVIAKEVEGAWKITGKFPYSDPSYSVAHPSVSVSGDTLFFISDNPKTSKGGTDIYMSVRKDTTWGNPVNIGNINSTGNESTPYFSSDGILFFSSDRIEGFGGFDIYYCSRKNNSFGDPVNFGSQINSVYDDFGFSLDNNLNCAYFVSNRAGFSGSDDLFSIPLKWLKISGRIAEKSSGKPIGNAEVKILDGNGNVRREAKSTDKGEYFVDIPGQGVFSLAVDAKGYTNVSFNDLSKVPSVVELERVILPEEQVFNFINQNQVNAKQETEETIGKVIGTTPEKQNQPAPVPENIGNRIKFTVQISAPYKPIDNTHTEYKNIKGLQFKKIGKFYIYYVKLYDDIKDAIKEKEELVKIFPDCFVIAFDGGKKISVKEALAKKSGTK